MLVSIEGAVQMVINSCSRCFMEKPGLLTKDEYKAQVLALLQPLKQFIQQIEEGSDCFELSAV